MRQNRQTNCYKGKDNAKAHTQIEKSGIVASFSEVPTFRRWLLKQWFNTKPILIQACIGILRIQIINNYFLSILSKEDWLQKRITIFQWSTTECDQKRKWHLWLEEVLDRHNTGIASLKHLKHYKNVALEMQTNTTHSPNCQAPAWSTSIVLSSHRVQEGIAWTGGPGRNAAEPATALVFLNIVSLLLHP